MEWVNKEAGFSWYDANHRYTCGMREDRMGFLFSVEKLDNNWEASVLWYEGAVLRWIHIGLSDTKEDAVRHCEDWASAKWGKPKND